MDHALKIKISTQGQNGQYVKNGLNGIKNNII